LILPLGDFKASTWQKWLIKVNKHEKHLRVFGLKSYNKMEGIKKYLLKMGYFHTILIVILLKVKIPLK